MGNNPPEVKLYADEAIKTNKLNLADSALPGSFNLSTLIPHLPNITPPTHKKTATDIKLMPVAFSLSKYAP